MNASTTTTPVKDEPHPFQPTPEVPIVYPTGAALGTELSEPDGSILEQPDNSNCALCSSPRNAKIHVDGKDEADAQPIRWG